MRMHIARRAAVTAALFVPLSVPMAQSAVTDTAPSNHLTLGFAVDTTVVPSAWWGVDPARSALPGVVRTWSEYLAIRANPAKRVEFWSAADRARSADPDLVAASQSYLLGTRAELVEALPVVAGDSSRWLLRTTYVAGSGLNPKLLAMERSYMVREDGRWLLSQTSAVETASWRHVRVGPITYVVHPALRFDIARARATARWATETAHRFGLPTPAPLTYYLVPDVDATMRVIGLDLGISADRVGGRAIPPARIVLAGDPRFGEAYRHEIAHVLLAPVTAGKSGFVVEGIAYWLGGARGLPFPTMMRSLARLVAAHPQVDLRAILDTSATPTAASARLPAAAGVFELIHRRGGDAAVRRFIRSLGEGEPSLATLANAMDMTPTALNTAWLALVDSYACDTKGNHSR